MATSKEIQQYIDSFIEQSEESTIKEKLKDKKQNLQRQLIDDVSADIALFFNKIIYCINQGKKNTITYSDQKTNDKKTDFGAQSSAFRDESNDEEEEAISTKNKKEKKNIQSSSLQVKSQNFDLDKLKAKQMQLYSKLKDESQSSGNTPKKPVSSFFLFYQERSKDLAVQTGQVVGAKIAQLVADSWHSLDTQQKRPYNQRALADKERYRQQMGKYIQTHSAQIQQIKRLKRMRNKRVKEENRRKQNDEGQQNIDNQEEDQLINMKIKGISQRQMKAADRKAYSHRPKAPVSSFFLFYQEEAKNIANQFGQTVGSRLARLASNIWKGMSPESKEKYQKVAKVERQRYHQQMIQYKIDYPEEVQNRRKKISNNMKRTLSKNHEKQPKQADQIDKSEKDSNQDIDLSNSLENISDLSSNSSQIQNKQIESTGKLGKQDRKSVSSNSYVSSNDSDNQQGGSGKDDQKNMQDRTPHKPRAPIGSFFQYYNANLHIFHKKASMSQKETDPFQLASQVWKTLNLDQKKPYFQMANKDILRYKEEIQDFRSQYPAQYAIFHKQKGKMNGLNDSLDQ